MHSNLLSETVFEAAGLFLLSWCRRIDSTAQSEATSWIVQLPQEQTKKYQPQSSFTTHLNASSIILLPVWIGITLDYVK